MFYSLLSECRLFRGIELLGTQHIMPPLRPFEGDFSSLWISSCPPILDLETWIGHDNTTTIILRRKKLKMATGTFTHSSYRTQTLTTFIKKVQKSYKIFKPTTHNVLSTGTNIVKIWLSLCLIRCVRFARYCGKMYSRHLFATVDSPQACPTEGKGHSTDPRTVVKTLVYIF